MATVFHAWLYGRFIEIQSKLRRKKLYRTNEGSNFLGGSFRNRDNVRTPFQFRRESQSSILKDDFPQEQTHPFSHQQDQCYQLSFFSIEINKLLPAPVYSVSQITFRSQFLLLSQVRCLNTFIVEVSVISIDSNITDNIIREVIDEQQEKCRTKNGSLRNSSINCIFLSRLPIHNYLKQPITEKRRNKAKYVT